MCRKRKFEVKEYRILSNKIPEAFSGTTVVFLTDLHDRQYGNENSFLLEEIDRICPDYIFIGGDMVVGNSHFDKTVVIQLIKKLAPKYPVYYSQGNHEQKLTIREETKDDIYPEFVKEIQSYGVKYLVNEHITMEKNQQSICLSGLSMDYSYYKKNGGKITMSEDYLKEELGEITDKKQFHILLAHNPKYFEQYAEWGADLVLSGHVHGGIVILPWIGGIISPSYELFPKYDFGEFHHKNSTMILSKGLGVHTIPIRIHNTPELSVIRLIKDGK